MSPKFCTNPVLKYRIYSKSNISTSLSNFLMLFSYTILQKWFGFVPTNCWFGEKNWHSGNTGYTVTINCNLENIYSQAILHHLTQYRYAYQSNLPAQNLKVPDKKTIHIQHFHVDSKLTTKCHLSSLEHIRYHLLQMWECNLKQNYLHSFFLF